MKAQVRHTPATNSTTSMVHPAADAACKTKKTKFGPARDTSAKVVIQDGWSVPVVHSFEECRLADTGTCLATRSKAEEAMRELRSGGGLAILMTKQVVATAYWLKKIGAEPSGLLSAKIRRDRWCGSGGQGSERQLRDGSSRKRRVRCLLSPLLCQRRRPRVQGYPTPSRIRPPGAFYEGEGGRSFRPRGCLSGKGSRIALKGVRLRQRLFPGLLRGGIQDTYRRQAGGHKSTSVVEQSCGAGISARLALHSRSIFPSREDQECHHPVSGAASPPKTSGRLWVFAHPARGTTQTSKCAGPGVVKTRKTTAESQKAAKSWASVRGNPTPPVTAKRPLAGSESMDATALGAITPTQAQDNNLGPTQVSLSPRSQRLDSLQPPQSPVLADVVAQLQVLMASVQSIATTVGQLGVQLHSLQTEGNEKCRQRGRRVRRTRWFLLRSWRKRVGHGRSPRRAKIQLCQTYAVLSGVEGGAVFKASRRVFVAFSCAVHLTPCAHHQR